MINPATPQVIDEVLDLGNDGNSFVGKYPVRVIINGKGIFVVIAELHENGGMSICNGFEGFIRRIVEHFELPFITHYFEYWGPFSYPAGPKKSWWTYDEPTLILVNYEWELKHGSPFGRFFNPQWERLDRQTAEALIGAEFSPFAFENV
jgi:hypothetical protein